MTPRALGLVIGQGSLRMRQHREDRFPVVEKRSRARACLFMLGILIALATSTKRVPLWLVFRLEVFPRAFARSVHRLHEGVQHLEGLPTELLR